MGIPNAELLKAERVEDCGDNAVVFTAPMSVKEMHEIAQRLRKGGAGVFFAEI